MPEADDGERIRLGRVALGARIRSVREAAGITAAAAASGANISYSYLSDVERGRRLPTLEVLDALARTTRTTVRALLDGLYPWDGGTPPATINPPPDGRSHRHQRRDA